MVLLDPFEGLEISAKLLEDILGDMHHIISFRLLIRDTFFYHLEALSYSGHPDGYIFLRVGIFVTEYVSYLVLAELDETIAVLKEILLELLTQVSKMGRKIDLSQLTL